MSLTDLKIRTIKPRTKSFRVSDGDGLYLEICPSGSRLWRFRYRHSNKEQMMALGSSPAVSLAAARVARDKACEVLALGKNPSAEKRISRLRQLAQEDITFEKVCRQYLELRINSLNKKYYTQCLARLQQHIFPKLGPMPITDIHTSDVARLLENIATKHGTPETARRMGQLIRQTFRYANQRGYCQNNPASDLAGIVVSPKDQHHACISPEQLPELIHAIEHYKGDLLTKYAIKLMALTFTRTQELIAARWCEFDLEKGEWNIPKERMKMRRPHMVPLSKQAIKLLNELRLHTGQFEFVFYSARSRHKHISNGAILMALRRMGYSGRMTGHGFRTLASTILNERGFRPDVIERQLAHQDDDQVRAAYNRAEYVTERKKLMQIYADILDQSQAKKTNLIRGSFSKKASRVS